MAEYRYVLRRDWGFDPAAKIVNFIMLNPSTASDTLDGPTIRRCVGFAKRWGFGGLTVTNLFAMRATDPKDLKVVISRSLHEAIGKDNASFLEEEASAAHTIVCAWGDNCEFAHHRDLDVISSLREFDLYCIRRTKKGNPAHPVREGYTDAPEIFYSKLNTFLESACHLHE